MQRDDGEQRERGDQRFRMSSHKKNGPPMSAVMIPTGRMTGAISVRANAPNPVVIPYATSPRSSNCGTTRSGASDGDEMASDNDAAHPYGVVVVVVNPSVGHRA